MSHRIDDAVALAPPRPALTSLAPEELVHRARCRSFALERVSPHVAEMDERSELDPTVLEGLFEEGLMGVAVPRELGGVGGSLIDVVLVIEELAKVDPGVAVWVHVQNTLVVNALVRWGNEAHQGQLAALAANTVGAYALSEDGSGSDAFALTTEAVPFGDEFVVSGRKRWTSNAAQAGLFLVFARMPSPAGANASITALLIERDRPGLRLGDKAQQLGMRASPTYELLLDAVRVPRENVVGRVGEGNSIVVETLNYGRVGIAAQMVGLAQGALEAAVAYSQCREQFGRRIAAFQAVQFGLAEMATKVEAARLLTYNAARLIDTEASPTERFRAAAMAKYFAADVAEQVASQALEVFGARGLTKEFAIERLYRDSKVGAIYEGTSNMQLRTIASTLLQGTTRPGCSLVDEAAARAKR